MAKNQNGKKSSGLPNMHDVARIAGVSQMTVSRVMRGTGYISSDVRQQVQNAAREIGYVHNRLAGGNLAYDNPLVGVVVPTLQNRVFTEVLSGISDTLGESHLRPVFGVSEYSLQTEEELVFDFLSWRPRGLILPGLEHNHTVRQIVSQTGVRTAEYMDIDGDPMSACFGISHEEVGAGMAQYLVDRGYRTFGYIASQGGTDLRAAKRLAAFSRRVVAAGGQMLEQRIADEASSMGVGRQLTQDILACERTPDALYYSNDDLAAGGLMHCLANGIKTPDDVAIAGFNGLAFLSSLPLRITTTQTPRYEMGVAAAKWIAASANAESEGRKHALKSTIVVGDTA